MESNRIAPLESLRGLLALWVVAGHVLSISYNDPEIAAAHMGLINQPVLAVQVFVMLSGFVIMLLLDREQLPYRAFVIRRFFRIGPMYFLTLLIAAATLAPQLAALESLPWRHANILTKIAIRQEAMAHLWPHLAAHLLLLQGMVSQEMISFSNYTFVGPAWSISLEWQFYLIAPLIYWLVRNKNWSALCVGAAVCAVLKHWNYQSAGFLPNQYGYFAIGVISYFLYRHGRRMGQVSSGQTDFIVVCATSLLYFFFALPWPLIMWFAVLAAITFENGVLVNALRRFLGLGVLRWLGQISYSVYLNHMLVMYLVFGVVMQLMPNVTKGQFLPIVLGGTIGLTVAISALTYWLVEKPGVQFGYWASGRRRVLAEVSLNATP